ncbi:MAG: IS110 family transposase [Coriobacteriia bacterium]|nr:IS110 family transposase [Coriobacteriia bacterium]
MNHRTSIGLDVHARSIKAAAFVPETGEIIERSFAYSPLEVTKWALSLPTPVCAVYESGPTGFDLARKLSILGVGCEVGAVTKMLRPAGDRIKTDKLDAVFLARMLAVGNIVSVHIPLPEEEAARDAVRAREDARLELTRSKLLLRSFLLRKGVAYDGGSTSTKKYKRWLDTLHFDLADEQFTFEEYIAGIAQANQKKKRLDEQIKVRATDGLYAERVARIQCIRGIGTLIAFSIVVEIGGFNRFPECSGIHVLPGACADRKLEWREYFARRNYKNGEHPSEEAAH